MKTRWQELRAKHWSNRPAQERVLLAWAAVLLTPIIYYYLLWEPAHQGVAKLRIAVPILRAQQIKLNEQAAEVESLNHRPQLTALDATALKISIESSLLRHQLRTAINSMEVQEPNGIRIASDAIPYIAFITWLRELQQEQHIRVDSLSISALPQVGMVKISATLINGGNQ
jgi:general secretion pathway protein M